MNEREKEELKAEIIADIEEKFKGIAIREDTQGVLSEARNKWFRDAPNKNTNRYNKWKQCPMYQIFGGVTYWTVWELIRKLVCIICGVGYVRQIQNREAANEIAEALCQTVYDLRTKYSAQANREDGNKETEAHNGMDKR